MAKRDDVLLVFGLSLALARQTRAIQQANQRANGFAVQFSGER